MIIVAIIVIMGVVLACFAVWNSEGPFCRFDKNGKPVDSKGYHLREEDREVWERGGMGRM